VTEEGEDAPDGGGTASREAETPSAHTTAGPSEEAPRHTAPNGAPSLLPRARTWPARIGEFFAIVFGILVALAGDAWWDTRVERREEREALVALYGEFTSSLGALEAGARRHERTAEALARLREWTGPRPELPPDDVVASALDAAIGAYTTYNDRRGVLDGVIASGGLRLVQNDSLRAMLAGWPAAVEEFTEDEALALELRNQEMLPYVYRLIPVRGSEFPRDYQALFADPYFDHLLEWRYLQIRDAIMPGYREALTELRVIVSMIASELGIEDAGGGVDSLRLDPGAAPAVPAPASPAR